MAIAPVLQFETEESSLGKASCSLPQWMTATPDSHWSSLGTPASPIPLELLDQWIMLYLMFLLSTNI